MDLDNKALDAAINAANEATAAGLDHQEQLIEAIRAYLAVVSGAPDPWE